MASAAEADAEVADGWRLAASFTPSLWPAWRTLHEWESAQHVSKSNTQSSLGNSETSRTGLWHCTGWGGCRTEATLWFLLHGFYKLDPLFSHCRREKMTGRAQRKTVYNLGGKKKKKKNPQWSKEKKTESFPSPNTLFHCLFSLIFFHPKPRIRTSGLGISL